MEGVTNFRAKIPPTLGARGVMARIYRICWVSFEILDGAGTQGKARF